MELTAEIICRQQPYGPICEWKGPRSGVAKFFRGGKENKPKRGDVLTFGRLKLRVIDPLYINEHGAYCDSMAVMLESPHAQLFQLYREHANRIVRFVGNIEMRLWAAWRGLMLRESPEGKQLRLTSRLADLLL